MREISDAVVHPLDGKAVYFFDVNQSAASDALPKGWNRIDASIYFDPDAFRREFLHFLESAPQTKVIDGKSIEESFTHLDGYSVWWTSVGAMRNPNRTPVRDLQALWIIDRVITDLKPTQVVVAGLSKTLRACVASRCKHSNISIESLDRPNVLERESAGILWVIRHAYRLACRPIKEIVIATIARIFLRIASESSSERCQPAICFRPRITRSVEIHNGRPELPFWSDFCEDLSKTRPDIKQKFLLRQKEGNAGARGVISWLRNEGRPLYDSFEGAIRPAISYTSLRRMIAAAPVQIAAMLRFRGIQRSGGFDQAFRFANANVTACCVPPLRKAIETMAIWECESEQIYKAIKNAGNVKAILVLAEFYQGVMPGIAATRRLGIPTIGIQHGTIMPMHLVYTVPAGHVTNAPVPDFFASYGPYATHVVSTIGKFPQERVWEVGAPRLDHLVSSPRDKWAARQSLELQQNQKVVLIATQTYPWFPEAVGAVIVAAKDHQNCIVCIKTHFGDRNRLPRYKELADQYGMERMLFFTERFDDLLAACDILVSATSTTLLEASLLGIQSICVNFSSEPDRYPYVEDGASLPGRSADEIKQSLDFLLSGKRNERLIERRNAFLARHAGPTASGKGSEELVGRISELIPKNTPITS
ncbi:MAG: CDP-glycerol glycerophosphotransferase family protein [Planctomycetales bacterium]|nr:CDP-glycerol glycerophosphotransferase family protein [Planctomycetales bacterium]